MPDTIAKSLVDIALAASGAGALAVSQGPSAVPVWDPNLSWASNLLTQKGSLGQVANLHEYRDGGNTLVKSVGPDGGTLIDVPQNRSGGCFVLKYGGTQGQMIGLYPSTALDPRFPASLFDGDAAYRTTGYVIVSGWDNRSTATGPDDYLIYPPTNDPSMIGAWSDVEGPTVQLKTNVTNYCYHLSCVDSNDNYMVSILKDGSIGWGDGTKAVTGLPNIDTNLYRGGANLLKTDWGFQTGGGITTTAIAVTTGSATFLEGNSVEWPGWKLTQVVGGNFTLRDITNNRNAMLYTPGATGSLAVTADVGIAGAFSATCPRNVPFTLTQQTQGINASNALTLASDDPTGAVFRLQSSANLGHTFWWLATASGSGLGAGKLAIYDSTSSKVLLLLDQAQAALPSATAAATYGANEQTMLQAVYDFVKTRNPQS